MEMLEETLEKIDNEKNFDGIEYFQSYINKKMKSLIELLPEDFSVIFDESSEIFSKLAQIDENYSKQIEENTQKALALPLKNKAHLEFEDFQNVIAKREKIFFDNFLDTVSDYTEEFESTLIPSFSSKMEEIITFVEEKIKQNYKVVIATDYRNRIEEVLDDFEMPYSDRIENQSEIYLTENIALGGSLIEDFKLVVLTDRELFNKKSKDITAKKSVYHKESVEYIESDVQR